MSEGKDVHINSDLMQILIVEDDNRISEFLVKGLKENGHIVTLCNSAEKVISDYISMKWDVIICDIMLPNMDGKQLVQILRYKKNLAPVLMLSALNEVEDKISSLNFGADDYITKPFHFDELLSRINALHRRFNYLQRDNPQNIVEIDRLRVDFDKYQVFIDNQLVELSLKEFKLLSYLIDNKNKAVSRVQILNAVWGINFDNQTNIVDVYISYLRNKILCDSKYIYTVKGIGYMFKSE